MFFTIVVGIDGSDSAARALASACTLAKAHGGALHIVHAPEPAQGQDRDVGAQIMSDATQQAQAIGVKPDSTTVGKDSPWSEIMTIVELYEADLIVTGRRGLGGVSGLFMGSTSQKIAQLADCPCLTVK